jgi:hypothetical protein
MSNDQPAPVTDSPWFWVLTFSLMALFILVLMGPKIGRRQAKIELNYQARERVAAEQEAGNNPNPGERSDELADRQAFATPEDTLVPLWPLATILLVVVLVSWYMLFTRGRGRLATASSEQPGSPVGTSSP